LCSHFDLLSLYIHFKISSLLNLNIEKNALESSKFLGFYLKSKISPYRNAIANKMIGNCFFTGESIKAKMSKIARLFYSFKRIEHLRKEKMKRMVCNYSGNSRNTILN
jgi:hypothetical protein